MKAGIFDPYLDTLGGGERYCLTLAEYLLKNGWQVDIFWDNESIKRKAVLRFGLDFTGLNFLPKRKLLRNRFATKGYNLFFWVSDGSIPLLLAKKSILHFQVPFHDINGQSCFNKLKLKMVKHIVCNSHFTKKFIDKEYGVNSEVIFPPIDVEKFKPVKKQKIILSVSRFSRLLQAKRQDVLIDVFKKMCDKGLVGWKLILAGGLGVGGREYFNHLKRRTELYPIEILGNPNFETLQRLYGQASIFWFASGFGIDENKFPQQVEHFGMTVAEAMAAGCVPVVVDKGGPKEIIHHREDGFLWQTKKDLEKITLQLIEQNDLLKKISEKVLKSSKRFSKENFCEEFAKIIN